MQALAQMFMGIRVVKAFRTEERELERYEGLQRRYIRTNLKMVRSTALSQAWTLLYTHMGLAGVLLVLGWLTLRDGSHSRSSDLLPFFLLISRAYSSIKVITRGWAKVAESRGACDRLLELLAEPQDIVERPDAGVCAGLGTGLVFEDVSFTYPNSGTAALRELNLEVRPGETLAVVGPGAQAFVDFAEGEQQRRFAAQRRRRRPAGRAAPGLRATDRVGVRAGVAGAAVAGLP